MNTQEDVARTSLNILCDIFKENVGVYNYQIARAAGVDKTLLCKWRKGTAKISDICRLKLVSYFSQQPFERYRYLIMNEIIKAFDIQENGRVLWMMEHMDYTALIDYMFKELKAGNTEYNIKHVYGPFLNQIILHRVKTICPDLTHITCSDVESEHSNVKELSICLGEGEELRFLLIFADDELEEEMDGIENADWVYDLVRRADSIEGVIKLKPPQRYVCPTHVGEYERMVDMVSRKILHWIMTKNK